MIPTKDWLRASWGAGIDLLRPVSDRDTGDALSHHTPRAPVVVPIRSLGATYRDRIAARRRCYTGTAVVVLTRSSTKLVLQSCTLGCLSRVSMMKRL